MVSASDVKTLRERSGAGMMDCKKALQEANGDMEKASELLREKGIAAEGIVGSYIHMGGKIGVLVEVNCETDFVAKTDAFQAFVKDVAMHIAAANPMYVSEEEIDPAVLEKEKEILTAQALNEGKANVVEKMVEGRIKKFKKEICLLDQPFVKDPDRTVQELVNDQVATIGEKISIRRFTRYEMGEGLEKRQDDFQKEVMEQAGL